MEDRKRNKNRQDKMEEGGGRTEKGEIWEG